MACTAVLTWLCGAGAAAQERIGPFMAYSWRLGLSAGLNGAVCESPDGFLWIATGNGLIKFDGRHYHRITAGPAGTPDNIVTDVAAAADGNSVWIGFLRRGAARFDVKTHTFRAYPQLWNFDSHTQSVRKILCLGNGQVWLGTAGMGLALYTPGKDTFQFFTPEPLSLFRGEPSLSYIVNDMTYDSEDAHRIWLVCNNGIYRFDTRSKEFHAYPLPPNHNYYWTTIAHDGKDGLWLGTWGNSMFHYNTSNGALTPLRYSKIKGQAEQGMVVMDVEQVNDTTVLWACAQSGLLAYNPAAGRFRNLLPAVRQDESAGNTLEFTAVSQTPNAGVFAGAKGYLFQLHPYYSRLGQIIVPAPWAPGNEIYTGAGVFDSRSGQYLIPAAGPLALLAVQQRNLSAHAPPLPVKGLKDLALLPSGLIAALGFDGKLYVLDAVQNELKPLPLSLPPQEGILKMKVDRQGYLWALSGRNLYRLDVGTRAIRDSFSFHNFSPATEKSFHSLYLYHLETNAAGHAWLGSSQGLWLARPGEKQFTLIHPGNDKGKWLRDKLIKSMAMDDQDRLWIGYNGDGLDIFDTRTMQTVPWPQGAALPARQINDLAYTPGGYILAPTTEGLIAIHGATLDYQIFGAEDGLISQFMDKGLWVAPDGMVFINQGDRLNVFHESCLQIKRDKLQLNILRLKVNDAEQDLSLFLDSVSHMTLPYYSNNISLSFSAMHWLYPFKTQYRYRLRAEQSPAEWVDITEPSVQLNALPPGSYMLELAAKGAGGAESHPKVLYIDIRPPFWVRSWFLALCSALLLLLLYEAYCFRLRQLNKQANVRDTISRNLHDDIGSSLSNIQILTELAQRNLGERHEASTFLERAGEDIRRISEALSEIVWNVNPKYDDLQFLFARMRRYAADALEGMDIRYELDFPEEAVKLKMGMEQRRDFYLIFKESIHNLVKYSRAQTATVKVEIQQRRVLLEVGDDGIGFSIKDVSTGTGLISMQQRAKKWKGQLTVQSAPGKGTLVWLSMPLK